MNTITTPHGTRVHLDRPARASYLTRISANGGTERYDVRLTGKTRTYEEFMEEFTEFEAEDWDGSMIYISENDILQ